MVIKMTTTHNEPASVALPPTAEAVDDLANINALAEQAAVDAKVTNVYIIDGLLPVARVHDLETANTFAKKLKQGEFYASAAIIAQTIEENKLRLTRASLRVLKDNPKITADDIFQAAADRVKKDGDLKKKQADIEVSAGLLWEELEAFDFEPQAAPPAEKEKKPRAERTPKDPKKVSYVEHVLSHFTAVGAEKTLDELVAGTSYNVATIKHAFYDILSPKRRHFYKGVPVKIIKAEGKPDGTYVRVELTAEDWAAYPDGDKTGQLTA